MGNRNPSLFTCQTPCCRARMQVVTEPRAAALLYPVNQLRNLARLQVRFSSWAQMGLRSWHACTWTQMLLVQVQARSGVR